MRSFASVIRVNMLAHTKLVSHVCAVIGLKRSFVCSLQPCAHLLGKGWSFGSVVCCIFLCFATFPYGVPLDCIDSFLIFAFTFTLIHSVKHNVKKLSSLIQRRNQYDVGFIVCMMLLNSCACTCKERVSSYTYVWTHILDAQKNRLKTVLLGMQI